MARLPTYQESGLISADVPRLDFANLKEERAYSASVTESLDKISQFAFGQLKKQRDEENRIYGMQLRTEYESEVQKELNNLMVEVETGRLSDFNVIQDRVKALQGYATEIQKYDLDQANGLMRSISTGGNALLKRSSDILVKAYDAQVSVTTDETIRNLKSNLETLYKVETNPERIQEYEAGARSIAFAMAAKSPASIPDKLKDFEAARISARNAALTSYFMSQEFQDGSPTNTLERLRSGDAGRYSQIWQSMDEDQKTKVTDRMLKQLADDEALVTRQQKLTDQKNRVANIDDYDLYLKGNIGSDELLARYRSRGYIPSREEISAIRTGDTGGAELVFFGSLESLANRGQLSLKQAGDYFKEGKISLKQRNSLFKIIDRSEPPELARAKELISNEFVPNPFDPMTKLGNQIAADLKNQLISKFEEARKVGAPFDAVREAKDLISSRKTQDDLIQKQQIKDRLKELLTESKLQYKEDWTDEDLQRAGVSNTKTRASIMRQVKALRNMQ